MTDWTQDYDPNASNNAFSSQIATNGHWAEFTASRTSDLNVTGAMGTGGGFDLAVHDGPDAENAYGRYIEAWFAPTGNPQGCVQGFEVALINKLGTDAPDVNPYNQNPGGVIDCRIGIGKGDAFSNQKYGLSKAASAFLQFLNAEGVANAASHALKGIVFGAGSIITNIVIAMAQGHKLQWFTPDGKAAAFIRCDMSNGQYGLNAIIAQPGFYLQDAQGRNTHLFSTDGNGNGHVQVMQNGSWRTVI